MTFSHILFFLLLCVLTGSYTWGMRGSILGGERGAMLPGAALALVLLYAGGSLPMASAFPIAASVGAAGMFFGGSQTYGDTVGLTLSADAKERLRGRIGLAIKGGGWFGVFGGVFGFGLGAMSGRYALWETILFVVLLPVVRRLGILLFNTPMKPKEKKYPKLYYSVSRFEVWGGMLLVLLYILVFTACKREWFAMLLALFGCLFGAIGFVLGNLFQTVADAHLSKTWISGWKAMECTFGAVGALGIALCWGFFYDAFVSRYTFEITAHSGAWSPLMDKTETLLCFVWLLLLGLFIARYWFSRNDKSVKGLPKFLLTAEDVFIWPVFCLFPLFAAAVGDLFFAQVFSFFGLFYLLADKIVFSGKPRYDAAPGGVILQGVLLAASAVILFLQIFVRIRIGAYATWTMYLAAYLLTDLVIVLNPLQLRSQIRKQGSLLKALCAAQTEPTWLAYAVVCVIALLIVGKSYFAF